MNAEPIEDWIIDALNLTEQQVRHMKLTAVIDLFVSRIETARARGASDPLRTITAKRAGGNSRASTRRMLDQLHYTDAQRRAVHRLLTGSPGRWPGLLRIWADGRPLTAEERQYARRQVLIVCASTGDRAA